MKEKPHRFRRGKEKQQWNVDTLPPPLWQKMRQMSKKGGKWNRNCKKKPSASKTAPGLA